MRARNHVKTGELVQIVARAFTAVRAKKATLEQPARKVSTLDSNSAGSLFF